MLVRQKRRYGRATQDVLQLSTSPVATDCKGILHVATDHVGLSGKPLRRPAQW